MAVIKKGDGNIEITNGDLVALKKIADAYGVADVSDMIAFAIGVLDRSNGRGVKIETDDGTEVKFIPADRIKKTS